MLAGYSTDTYSPDQLQIGEDYETKSITLAAGQNLLRGSVLGKTVTAGTIAGTAVASNTGNGTIGTLSVSNLTQTGVYLAVCVKTAANGGVFNVTNPAGSFIGQATVGTAFVGEVNFTIADGSADFAVGDKFTIKASNLTEKYKLSAGTATDGSQVPDVILVHDCDATSADTTTVAFIEGDFNANKIILGTDHTVASVTEILRSKDIDILTVEA